MAARLPAGRTWNKCEGAGIRDGRMPVPAGTGFCCPGVTRGYGDPPGCSCPEHAGAAAPGEGSVVRAWSQGLGGFGPRGGVGRESPKGREARRLMGEFWAKQTPPNVRATSDAKELGFCTVFLFGCGFPMRKPFPMGNLVCSQAAAPVRP